MEINTENNTSCYVMVFKDNESFMEFSKEVNIKEVNDSDIFDKNDTNSKYGFLSRCVGISIYIDEDFCRYNCLNKGDSIFVREDIYLEYLKRKEKRDEEN